MKKMTLDDVEFVFRTFEQREHDTLKAKREAYVGNGNDREIDQLLNFRTVGWFLGKHPALICIVYMMKHIQALALAAIAGNWHDWSWETDDGREGLKQRIVDARNFLLLLACIFEAEADGGPDAS